MKQEISALCQLNFRVVSGKPLAAGVSRNRPLAPYRSQVTSILDADEPLVHSEFLALVRRHEAATKTTEIRDVVYEVPIRISKCFSVAHSLCRNGDWLAPRRNIVHTSLGG